LLVSGAYSSALAGNGCAATFAAGGAAEGFGIRAATLRGDTPSFLAGGGADGMGFGVAVACVCSCSRAAAASVRARSSSDANASRSASSLATTLLRGLSDDWPAPRQCFCSCTALAFGGGVEGGVGTSFTIAGVGGASFTVGGCTAWAFGGGVEGGVGTNLGVVTRGMRLDDGAVVGTGVAVDALATAAVVAAAPASSAGGT